MNVTLMDWLKAREGDFLSKWEEGVRVAWNARMASDCLSGGQLGVRMTSLPATPTSEGTPALLYQIFQNFLCSLEDPEKVVVLQNPLPHLNPYGARLTLGSFLEILLSGENTLKLVLLDDPGSPCNKQASLEFFNECLRALRHAFLQYAQHFCMGCSAPLVESIQRISNLPPPQAGKEPNHDK